MKRQKMSFKEFINRKKIAELDKRIKELEKQIVEYEGIESKEELPADYVALIHEQNCLIEERDKLK